jgi:phosphohistidine phosphatase
MELYLVRHGEAFAKADDAQRPLTDVGREHARRVALAARAAGVEVLSIACSGKLRARQTAELLAAELSPPGGVIDLGDQLDPEADPEVLRTVLEEEGGPTFERLSGGKPGALMLVGHLPYLARLTSLLMAGTDAAASVELSPAALVHLRRAGSGGWSLAAQVSPAFLPPAPAEETW